jgi:hypothetical protein
MKSNKISACIAYYLHFVHPFEIRKESEASSRVFLSNSLFGLLFNPEDGGSVFLRNVSKFLPVYTALHSKK